MCQRSHKESIGSTDTVRAPKLNLSNEVIKQLESEYYLRFGVAISKYYLVKDRLAIDLDGDERIDTLALLSPVLLEDFKFHSALTEITPKRILIEIINDGKNARLRNVYDNLSSHIGGVLSKYGGLYVSKRGVEIHHQSGAKYSWNYVTTFSTTDKDSLFLSMIQKTCSFNNVDDKKVYVYDKVSVRRISINDTIKANCNCDKSWERLQKIQEK